MIVGIAFAQPHLGGVALDGVANDARNHPRANLRLDQVVLRAGLHGGHGEFVIAQPRQNHHRRAGCPVHAVQGLQSLAVRQAQVEQHHVDSALGEVGKRVAQRARRRDPERSIGHRQGVDDVRRVLGVILDEQDVDRVCHSV